MINIRFHGDDKRDRVQSIDTEHIVIDFIGYPTVQTVAKMVKALTNGRELRQQRKACALLGSGEVWEVYNKVEYGPAIQTMLKMVKKGGNAIQGGSVMGVRA